MTAYRLYAQVELHFCSELFVGRVASYRLYAQVGLHFCSEQFVGQVAAYRLYAQVGLHFCSEQFVGRVGPGSCMLEWYFISNLLFVYLNAVYFDIPSKYSII